jgi:hypothetical protein
MSAEWVTALAEVGSAIGTIGAVILALYFARADSFRRQREQERQQAEQITAWMEFLPDAESVVDGEMQVKLIIQNTSNQLAYYLIASVVNAQTEQSVGSNSHYRNFIGRVPPGRIEYKIKHPGHGMHKRFSVELAFQDAAGRTWVRHGKGGLVARFN